MSQMQKSKGLVTASLRLKTLTTVPTIAYIMDVANFRQENQRAGELLQQGDLKEAGTFFQSLYASLRMNAYHQRLSKQRFDKVFFGLTPDDVLSLLFNKAIYHMNACETKEALKTLKSYQMIERDFSIHGAPDFDMAMNEVEVYRRLGDDQNALRCCEKLLKKKLEPSQKVGVLITKGSIETEESHNVFGINTLSLALAEAEADGNPNMIAHCYMEMAKMLGTQYPSLGLSFLWKARIYYERNKEPERIAFCKMGMALAYFLLWYRTNDQRFIREAKRLVNEDINRDDFRHPAGAYSLDRLKGTINNDLKLIETSLEFFESIQAYGEVLVTAEFYIKTALTIGDRAAAKEGARRYEKTALLLNDQIRVNYIRSLDLDHAVASWFPLIEQKDMPNLLDVLDNIALDEEKFHLENTTFRMLFPTHYQEGMFETVEMPDGKARLYPCALYPGRYFRGQSDRLEGKKCQPSLYRRLSDAEMFHERLCLKELENLLQDYPLTTVYEKGMLQYSTPEGPKPLCLNVDVTALGQHYGIKTDVLDLTADKWVAAFFAATKYENGVYLPYKEDGIGVIYVYGHIPAMDYASERLNAVGLQPFSRPGCQAGLVYKMMPEEDFNERAQRIFFKQDPAISEFIYNYCNRSKRLFPDEILENKVKEIKASKVYSRLAFTNTIYEYYQGVSPDIIEGYMRELGIKTQSTVPVLFTQEEMEAFLKRWNREKDHFFDSIIVRLSYMEPIKIEE